MNPIRKRCLLNIDEPAYPNRASRHYE